MCSIGVIELVASISSHQRWGVEEWANFKWRRTAEAFQHMRATKFDPHFDNSRYLKVESVYIIEGDKKSVAKFSRNQPIARLIECLERSEP